MADEFIKITGEKKTSAYANWPIATNAAEVNNSLTGFIGGLQAPGGIHGGLPFTQQLSKADTQYLNLRYYLVSNDRQLLNQMYVEHGIVQTLIDQPVDDAFRGKLEILTDQISADEIEELEAYLEKNRVIESIKQALKWARLFGGAGIILNSHQPYDEPLDIDAIEVGSPIEFIPADLWELTGLGVSTDNRGGYYEPDFYHYYNLRIDSSRIYRIEGKPAPAIIRQQLRGWGMSEVEKLIRSINQYMKNQNVIFELMDEAKIDVYRIKNFNSTLLSAEGTDAITKRFQLANMLKNFQTAVVMDLEDEYDQKSINFAGLGDMLKQIREGIAADLRMPVSKLFGVGSSGFSSGEDDIENYNSMIEGEIRGKIKYIIIDILGFCCKHLFGIVPDDLTIKFEALRMMSTEQEELIKTNQFNRTISSFQAGLIDGAEAQKALNVDDLLPIKIDESGELDEPISKTTSADYTTSTSSVEA
jgi:phage-related protein (TIGR01555 family)